MNYYRDDGSRLELRGMIDADASGKEGVVYNTSDDGEVVKLFNESADLSLKRRKILAMLERPPLGSEQNKSDGQVYIAWPTAVVNDEAGRFVGYTMPKMRSSRSIFLVKSKQKRDENFPGSDPLLTYVVAANLATVIRNLHSADYVIGDFAPQNFLVDDEGVVYAIDTDSYQMKDSTGTLLKCEVGTPDFFPAEYLRAMNSGAEVRFTAEGDLFSLAKLIFQLVMNGFDAHTGKSSRRRNAVDIDQYCVLENIYVYDNDAGFTPPRKAPSPETLPQDMRDAFHQCFVQGGFTPSYRPTAAQWEDILDNYYMEAKNVKTIRMPTEGSIIDSSIKRLPCILCLDTSGSMMEDDSITALNEGVASLVNTLRFDKKAQMVVDLAVMTFGGTPQLVQDFASVLDIELPSIEAVDGFTPFYAAVGMAFELMEKRIAECSDMGVALRPPVVIVMTDGKPQDKERRSAVLQQVRHIRMGKRMDIVAVGIGDDYDPELLDEICTNNWPRKIGLKQQAAVLPTAKPEGKGILTALFHRGAAPVQTAPRAADEEFRHVRLERNASNFISFFKLMSSDVAGGIR